MPSSSGKSAARMAAVSMPTPVNTLVKGRPTGQLRGFACFLILLVQPGDFVIQPGYVPFGGGPAAFRDPFRFLHPLFDFACPCVSAKTCGRTARGPVRPGGCLEPTGRAHLMGWTRDTGFRFGPVRGFIRDVPSAPDAGSRNISPDHRRTIPRGCLYLRRYRPRYRYSLSVSLRCRPPHLQMRPLNLLRSVRLAGGVLLRIGTTKATGSTQRRSTRPSRLPHKLAYSDNLQTTRGDGLVTRASGPALARDARGIVSSTQVPEGKCDRTDGDRDHGHGQQDQGMRDAQAVNQRFICFVVVEKRRESAGS